MRKLNKKSAFAILIIAALMISSLGLVAPKALAAGNIYIDPVAINDPSIVPGATIKVNASAANVADVFTWQAQVEYNPAVLNCTKVTIQPTSIFKLDVDVAPIINNVAGKAVIGSTKIFGAGVTGSGVLATFEFQVIGRGYSKLNYSSPLGVDTFLLDSGQHDISVTVVDSYFNNYIPPPSARLYIKPSTVVNPTLTPGTSFNVNLSIANGTDVHYWTANILYNNTVLNGTDAVEGSYLKGTGTTTFTKTVENNFNATHGQVHLSCALASGGANGDGDLAMIVFQVSALGDTQITITDVNLFDSTNASLPFTTENGYFSNVALRDIAVVSVVPTNTAIAQGCSLNITVVVENKGDNTEPFNVTLRADAAVAAPSQRVENLPSHGNTALLFIWDTSSFAIGNYTITAAADILPGEANPADNTMSGGVINVMLPGDVNGDGKVDMRDIEPMRPVYGATFGVPQWNPNADQDGNGRVDLRDIAIMLINFGKHYP